MKKRFRVLGLFLLGIFGLQGFGFCEKVENLLDIYEEGTISVPNGNTMLVNMTSDDYGVYCIEFIEVSSTFNEVRLARFASPSDSPGAGNYLNIYSNNIPGTVCIYNNQPYIGLKNYNSMFTLKYRVYNLDVLLDTTIPVMSSNECQSEYSLMPISSCNSEYCELNDLCSSSGISSGYSALYINDIRHESMPFINITIPEEFNWDYSYTGNNTQFDLNIIGYNTDPDYIAGIINTQSTKPNSTDFNNIVSGLIPLLIPGLVILLFIWFVFKFIKKIF